MLAPEREAERLRAPGAADERPPGPAWDEVCATCRDVAPEEVLRRVVEVMEAVVECSRLGLAEEDYLERLPPWFRDRFAPEMTRDEADRMSRRERQRARRSHEPYSAGNWIAWMLPRERCWWWWRAATEGDVLKVTVVGCDVVFPWDALAWLLEAAGAHEVRLCADPVPRRPLRFWGRG